MRRRLFDGFREFCQYRLACDTVNLRAVAFPIKQTEGCHVGDSESPPRKGRATAPFYFAIGQTVSYRLRRRATSPGLRPWKVVTNSCRRSKQHFTVT